MLGKWLPDRPLALERRDAGGVGRSDLGGEAVLAGVGFEIFEMKLHLLEQATAALGARAVLLAPKPGDLQLEMRDDRLNGALAGDRTGGARLGLVGTLQRSGEQRLEPLRHRSEGAKQPLPRGRVNHPLPPDARR